jgi:hypothetical protein
MERRDLIKDQIEQLGRVLGQILVNFLGRKGSGNVEDGVEIANEALKSQLDIDITEILKLTGEPLNQYFIRRSFNGEHIEQLADYLAATQKTAMITKAVELLDVADQVSNTYSFERINKKNNWLGILP